MTGPKVPWDDDVWAPVGVAAVLVDHEKGTNYSTYRKDSRYSTNISYRSCHFGGPKSTNHIEDNACCKSCPKQVFGGFQPHFWGIIFYMVCKWQLPFNINNSLVFTVLLAILTKLSGLLPGKCMYGQMPVCCQGSSTLAGFGGELLQQGLLQPSWKKSHGSFMVQSSNQIEDIPRTNFTKILIPKIFKEYLLYDQ